MLIAVLLGILIIGDPGRIDRDKTWLRVLTGSLIGLITAVNAVLVIARAVNILHLTTSSSRPHRPPLSGGPPGQLLVPCGSR